MSKEYLKSKARDAKKKRYKKITALSKEEQNYVAALVKQHSEEGRIDLTRLPEEPPSISVSDPDTLTSESDDVIVLSSSDEQQLPERATQSPPDIKPFTSAQREKLSALIKKV